MRVPELDGIIGRRILVNFHADPLVVERLLPEPFKPKLHHDLAMVGICLIRLEQIRPHLFPGFLGLTSENAAHRFAVCWTDGDGVAREGVYIPRRDSSSIINWLVGGRLFPGEHHKARFDIQDDGAKVHLIGKAADGSMSVTVAGAQASELPASSVFASVQEASEFFKFGSIGYSDTDRGDHLDGMVLETKTWSVSPFAVEDVQSSYFSDTAKFPQGSIAFDCALIMRNIEHHWRSAPNLVTSGSCCEPVIAS